MTTNENLLAELNAFRVAEGKDPFKDWRKARHMPMLETYRAAADFELPVEELAAQEGRPVHEDAIDAIAEALEDETTEVIVLDSLTALIESQEAARALAKEKSYKEVARYTKSAVDGPVAFVHQFLDANPGLSRKEAVMTLTSVHGINYSTARTQYQRWYSARKQG